MLLSAVVTEVIIIFSSGKTFGKIVLYNIIGSVLENMYDMLLNQQLHLWNLPEESFGKHVWYASEIYLKKDEQAHVTGRL
jgi:hypothetical protein